MKREATLHVVLETGEDTWPSDDVLKGSLAGFIVGERLWDDYARLPVTVAEAAVVNLRESS